MNGVYPDSARSALVNQPIDAKLLTDQGKERNVGQYLGMCSPQLVENRKASMLPTFRPCGSSAVVSECIGDDALVEMLSPEFLPRKPRNDKQPPVSKAASAGDRSERWLGAQPSYLLPPQWNCEILLLVAKMKDAKQKTDVPHGTLGLMVLKTLDVIGPLNGYAIARRIEQISGDLLAVNQGTLYPVLLKLEQEGAIASEWGASENNRRARFYRLSRTGRKLLQGETRNWEQTTAILARFFELTAEDLT
jgi:PadR family transcriptional regulator PadR